MPTYQYPAVYVAEVEAQVRPIEGVSTSTAALLGPDCLAHLTCPGFFEPFIPGGRLGWVKGDAAA